MTFLGLTLFNITCKRFNCRSGDSQWQVIQTTAIQFRYIRAIPAILLVFILSVSILPLISGEDLNDNDQIDAVESWKDTFAEDPLVKAGYRPRLPYPGADKIQTPEPMPEDAVHYPYGMVPQSLMSSNPTRATWTLHYEDTILTVYVDTQPGQLSSNEKNLLDRIISDFVNYSFPRVKDYFDPQDRVSEVTFYVHNIDGPSGTGGYYQPGTDEFHVDRADLSWAGEITAHEFQHYVHRQYDAYENLWVDEGCADYAAYLVYDFASALSSHIYQYLNNPYVTLPVDDYTFYTNNNGNDPATVYYGVSFSYQLYMTSHYNGRNWTRALVQRTSRGTSGVNSALSVLGSTDTFTDTFKKWMVATRVNDDNAGDGEEYSYPFKSYPYGSFETKILGSHSGIPVDSTKQLRSWAPKTYRFVSSPDGSETYRLKLSISSGTAAVAFYAETPGHKNVVFIPFTGSQAVFDLTGWGSSYQAFQLIMASSAVSDLTVNLDILDLDPPITVAGLSPMQPDGLDGWYKTQPKVTLKTESGADTYYQLDHGEEKHYNAPFYILNGIHNLSFYSIDPRDNTELRHFIDFKVDTIIPSSDIVIEPERPEDDWYQAPPTISLKTDHPNSDVFYKWGSDEYQQYTEPIIAPEGESTLMWKAADQAGNEESVNSRSFRVDTVSPEVVSSVYPPEPDGANGWYHKTPVVTLQTEGSSSIYYKIDNGEYFPYVEAIDISEGSHVFRAMAIDQASNQGDEISLKFDVDTTVPTIWGFFEGLDYSHENSSQWLQIAPKLTITSSEDDMNINYTINGGETIEYSETIVISEGSNEIRVYGEDKGGNVAEFLLYVVKVDSRAPKADLFIDDEPVDGWYRKKDAKLEIKLKEEEEGGSPTYIYYKWNGAAAKIYKEPMSIPEGSTSFVYWVEDEAGNSMDIKSLEVRKDSVLPSLFMSLQGASNNHLLEGENLTVDLTGSADDSGIAFYRIDFGDGSSVSWRVTGTFTTKYNTPGTYNITAYVKDSAGNIVNKTVMITVEPLLVEDDPVGNGGSDTGIYIIIGAVVVIIVLLLIIVEVVVIARRRRSHSMPINNHPGHPAVHGTPTRNGLPGNQVNMKNHRASIPPRNPGPGLPPPPPKPPSL